MSFPKKMPAGPMPPSGSQSKLPQAQMINSPGMPKAMPKPAVMKTAKKPKIRSIDDLKAASKNFGKNGGGNSGSGSGSDSDML